MAIDHGRGCWKIAKWQRYNNQFHEKTSGFHIKVVACCPLAMNMPVSSSEKATCMACALILPDNAIPHYSNNGRGQ